MFSFFLIYIIGKAFYSLAKSYGRHKWGYAILGVLSYYTYAVIISVTADFFLVFVLDDIDDEVLPKVLNLSTLILGLVGCWFTYNRLEKHWSEEDIIEDEDILDRDFINDVF